MRELSRWARAESVRPFWTLVGIRALFWMGTAITFLWAPATVAGGNPSFRAYEPLSDLLCGTFAEWDSG